MSIAKAAARTWATFLRSAWYMRYTNCTGPVCWCRCAPGRRRARHAPPWPRCSCPVWRPRSSPRMRCSETENARRPAMSSIFRAVIGSSGCPVQVGQAGSIARAQGLARKVPTQVLGRGIQPEVQRDQLLFHQHAGAGPREAHGESVSRAATSPMRFSPTISIAMCGLAGCSAIGCQALPEQ